MPSIAFNPASIFNEWLTANPCPSTEPGQPTINLWIASGARACQIRKVSPELAVDLIRAAMTRPEKFPREIARTVERVYSTTLAPTTKQPKLEAQYDSELLERQAEQTPFEITDSWLADRSTVSNLRDVSPAQYLDALFKPRERVAVMNAKQDRGFMYRPGDSESGRRLPKHLNASQTGAWYVSNPVNGEAINGSFRSEANITDFRHLMIESDEAPRDLWLRVIVQLCAPILAICESGNRSVHAIIQVQATDKPAFDAIAAQYKRQLIPLGMCPGSGKAVQPTRLPNVIRADNFAVQRLLYLRPDADATPILQK